MSFDHLHALMKAKRSPLVISLDPRQPDQQPLPFGLALIDAVADVIPAVMLRPAFSLAMGQEGLSALDALIAHAHEKGLFVIADAAQALTGPAARIGAQMWLDGLFSADCLTVSPYSGSDAIVPALEICRQADKCLLVQLRTGNPSGGEVQDMMAGDRVVCQVAGDLVRRLGRDDVGTLGYSRIGAVVQPPYLSGLRTMRKQLEHTWFLVSGPAEDARFAFDRYGRGAIVDVTEPFFAAAGGSGDYPSAARALQQEFKKFITIL